VTGVPTATVEMKSTGEGECYLDISQLIIEFPMEVFFDRKGIRPDEYLLFLG
jgi:hypothetical protein